MGCADADTLAALVANALPEAERAAVIKHAAGCEACHALLEGLLDGAGYEETVDSSKRGAALVIRRGTQIGRYEIGERLGAGGMGVVYSAVDTELQRRVAVKVLRPDDSGMAGSTQGRERLMREARMLARLSHPNVVTVFDVGKHDDNLFLAMELVDGGSLSMWLRRAPRTTDDILDRLIEAGRGLAAAHDAGVVHRDVKPDNVLVGTDGRARMTDFGLARFEANQPLPDERPSPTIGLSPDLTRTGTLMGTPVYMAPEQMQRGSTEPRTDQWSFCAMVYEVLAGVRPFPVDDQVKRSSEIAAGRLAPPAEGHNVPGWVYKIVARGLRADPAERWPTMADVVAQLERGRRRRRRTIVATAIGTFVVAAGIAIAVLATRKPPPRGLKHPPYTDETFPQVWTDDRAGCHCPYSPCTGSCSGECRYREYEFAGPVAGISLDDRQEALKGVSGDGDTIMFFAGLEHCMLDHLYLAHRHGSTYAEVDLSSQIDRTRTPIFEDCCTMTADARSLIMSRPDQRGFVRVRLAGDTVLPPQPTDDTELANVVPDQRDGLKVADPIISADEKTLYYAVYDPRGEERDSFSGSYMTTRASTDVPFTPGQRLGGRARSYELVSGVSADGLSLFMTSEFKTHVLVRPTTNDPWAGPGGPGNGAIPALLPGWRVMPTDHCKRLLATMTIGGCHAEQIIWLVGKD